MIEICTTTCIQEEEEKEEKKEKLILKSIISLHIKIKEKIK